MGGPPTEADFQSMLQHLNECSVCRERTWGFLMELRAGTSKLFDGLIEKLEAASEAALANAVAPEPTLEMETLADVVKKALQRLREQPDKKDWTSLELFGYEAIGDTEHIAVCDNCFKNFQRLVEGTGKAIDMAKKMGAKADELHNLDKLRKWFEDKFNQVQAQRQAGKSSRRSGSHIIGGTEAAFSE